MFNVKTLNNIAEIGLNRLDKEKYAVSNDFENPDAILVRSAKMHDMEFGDKLLCIARAGAGTNNIPIDRCTDQGIVVFNTPGANADAVKELVLCSLFLSSRDIIGGIEWVKSIAGSGSEIPKMVENGKKAYIGPEIYGKTLGVIGLGAIGARIAKDALALGMKVYGYDPYLSVDAAWRLSSNVIHATDVETIYANCDYITLHVPYLESTHHLIDAEAISKMKDGVRIINLARGELVDDDAVINGIDTNKVARYITDFPNEKTANVPNIIAIPHLGASTPESEDNCAVMAANEIVEYLENGNILNSVNMPRVYADRHGESRICIIHKNIPDMIAKITNILSSCRLNIENMVNSGRKNSPFAYTIIDVDAVPCDITETIMAIDGVIRMRII